MDDQLRIDVVDDAHAGELLTVRRAAFVTEAQLYGDAHIPALTQTLEELRADLQRPDVVTLAGWSGTRMVGSIRVGLEEDRALLGRLAVVPDLQGRGIGTRLLMAVLAYLPEGTNEVWVFTGQDSKQNLSLYAKAGYEHQYDQNAGDLTYAYLRKILGDVEVAEDGDDGDPEADDGDPGPDDGGRESDGDPQSHGRAPGEAAQG
ncbi:GNAT family N-acetyltransferase [Pseudactinotalea sp. Z1732]|uniref:GNAT family N-acetyltransferase n=1 Tax=Micrococcales TaxID=85006 RepID=UPI003C7A8A32